MRWIHLIRRRLQRRRRISPYHDTRMRPELRELLKHIEPISEYEIGFTIDICSQIVESHWSATHRVFEHGDPDNHDYNEALSDQNFRTAYQVQFIWQLAIWRINAVFEAVLSQWFPEIESLPIRQKLRALEEAGVRLPAKAKAELHSWIDLRNVFSHRPPEAPSFAHQVERSDVEDFAALTQKLLSLAKSHVTVGDANG